MKENIQTLRFIGVNSKLQYGKMKVFTLAGLLLLALCSNVQSTNYCSSTICRSGTHIACNNNGAWSKNCPSGARLIDINVQKTLVLNLHNDNRNRIAGGAMSNFDSASRMATMVWDSELAQLAALNVKQCAMKHDACHNTDKYRYSGQNLAWSAYSGSTKTDATLITQAINNWWSEHTRCSKAYINKYPSGYTGPAIGHFTAMATDRSVAVGCAGARYVANGMENFLFACNYASTNLIGSPVYVVGRAASGCSTGRHSKYTNLCSVNEKYANL